MQSPTTTETYPLSLHDALPILLVVIASPSAPERLAVASPVDPPPRTILLTRRTVRPPGVMSFTVDGTLRVLTLPPSPGTRDRKSTRLNSTHGYISYAVFCLKKK